MTAPRTSLFFKILRVLEIGLFVGIVLIAVTVIAGKYWLEHHVLHQEIRVGTGSLRIYGGSLEWDLQFFCDSARFESPTLRARVGRTHLSLNPIHNFVPGIPVAYARVDTAFLYLKPNPSSKHTPLDSLSFPDLKLPVKASLSVRALTVANDSGVLASAWKIHLQNSGSRKAEASIGTLASPLAGTLRCSVSTRADWSPADSVDLDVNITREKDRVHLTTRHAKADLLRGRGALRIEAADSRPYTAILKPGKQKIPFAQGIQLDVTVARADSIQADARLQAEVSGFPDSLPLILSTQNVGLHIEGTDRAARLQIQSRGRTGETLILNGEAREIPAAEKDAPLPLWRRYAASLQGSAEKFRVRTKGKILPAGARLEKAQWDGRNLSALLTTDDGSRMQARGSWSHGNGAGTFSVHLAPAERWVTAFTDTSISFAALEANGSVAGKIVTASLNAKDLSVYGFKIDSLTSQQAYGPAGYELKSSRLYVKNDVWSLTGNIKTAQPHTSLDFLLQNPLHGSLEYFLQRDSMKVSAHVFEAGRLPYAALAKLPVRNPMVDGTFEWSPKRRTGAVDAQVAAEFQNEKIEAGAKGRWNPQRLDAEKLTFNFKSSSLTAAARVKLNGRQFYELSKLRIPDYEYVSLQTARFDLAWALSLLHPSDPLLKSGQMLGEMVYADTGGFQGSLVFSGIVLNRDIGDVALKRLQLDGTGDSLIVLGVTQSAGNPLLRDSLRMTVTHALQDTQRVRIDAVAGDSLRLQLDAASSHFQALQGRLQIQGKAVLPQGSGVLDHLQTDMSFSLPLRNTLAQGVLTTRAFEGDYSVPSVTREHFSLNPELRAGVLRIPQVTLRDSSGGALRGSADYDVARKALHAHFDGDIAAQWTQDDKIALKDLKLDAALDSGGARLSGGFSQGKLLYVDLPLHAEGTLKDVTFAFAQPPAPAHGGKRAPPSLQFSGALSQSLIRYSLKSLSAIQAVFQKERNKKRGGRAQPIQLNVKVYTVGDSNRVDSDILRMAWVGNLELQGLYPFTLAQGRVNSLNGELGLPNQAYQIQQLEAKWLNAPLEEGEIRLEARKNLASTCQKTAATDFTAQDSCAVIMHLQGPLSQLRFSYDSDCGGAFGAGASVVAILTSVERGCYDPSFANGGGANYGGTALSLLEPTISQNLSTLLGRYSHSWIAETDVTGLSSLASGKDTVSDSISQALSVQVTSKEFMHVRLKVKSGYHTESQDLSSPWENMLALEWRPPLQDYVNDESWKRRLQDHVSVTASVQTVPVERNLPQENPVQKTLALGYLYDFWGSWWNKPAKNPPKKTSSTSQSVPVTP